VENHLKATKPLLYLTGDKNRDTVPTLLKEGEIAFMALQVYETRPRPGFQQALHSAVETIESGKLIMIPYSSPKLIFA